jgi:Erv1 / Alr family
MDTRFWGPSGWQLFHLIAFKSDNTTEFLEGIKDILPCKFCRESTGQFMKELPLKGDRGKWMFDLHNMVNHKLRTQCRDDPAVIDPGPDPEFEDVKKKYESVKPKQIPGRDFLFSVAVNYPDEPTDEQASTQRTFLNRLSKVFPFVTFEKYIESNPPKLESQKTYMKWMYGLFLHLSKKFHVSIPSYRGYVQRVMYYKSGCSKKFYKGKTCRRLAGGGFTKIRDHRKTRRITYSNLLSK